MLGYLRKGYLGRCACYVGTGKVRLLPAELLKEVLDTPALGD